MSPVVKIISPQKSNLKKDNDAAQVMQGFHSFIHEEA